MIDAPIGSRRHVLAIDLGYEGLDGAAAAYLVRDDPGAATGALVECGPMACLPALERGLRSAGVSPESIRDVLVTHIHLDHAGAAAAFAERGATIHVHPRGARHLIDPTRLVESARLVHGPALDRLYGIARPIAPDRVRVVESGDVVRTAGLEFTAIDTPGHARHHHAWAATLGGEHVCFTGDVAAMRVPGTDVIRIPMAAPEFDPDAWDASIAQLEARAFDALYLTHFGRVDAPAAHLAALRVLLADEAASIRTMLEAGCDDDTAIAAYRDRLAARARDAGIPDDVRAAFMGRKLAAMNVGGVRVRIEREASGR